MVGHKIESDARVGAERRPEHVAGLTPDTAGVFDGPCLMSPAHAPHPQATPDTSPTPFSAAC